MAYHFEVTKTCCLVCTVLEISYVWIDCEPYTVLIDGTGSLLPGFVGSGAMPTEILAAEGMF